MPISSEELTHRLAEADRQRVTLRKASRDLSDLGKRILKERNKRENDVVDRPERSSSSPASRD